MEKFIATVIVQAEDIESADKKLARVLNGIEGISYEEIKKYF